MTAANDLGLTNAVPAKIEFLVDGRFKPIKLGNQELVFKHAAPSRLHWAGRPGMRVVQALHWLRDVLADDEETARSAEFLNRLFENGKTGREISDDLRGTLAPSPIGRGILRVPLLQEAYCLSAEFRTLHSLPRPQKTASTFSSPQPTGLERRSGMSKRIFGSATPPCLIIGCPPGNRACCSRGGTSLSKAYRLIQRFSDDIDVTVFRDDLGQSATIANEALSETSAGRSSTRSGMPVAPTSQDRFEKHSRILLPARPGGSVASKSMRVIPTGEHCLSGIRRSSRAVLEDPAGSQDRIGGQVRPRSASIRLCHALYQRN